MSENTPLVGSFANLQVIEEEVNQAARSDTKVLITGESGVGKEVVARLIHQRSPRARYPFVAVNCAGLPDSLLESELFGHTRGSFTDAHRDTPGILELAKGGTVFLDEIGETSLRMQALLLRFLENGEIQRIGQGGTRRVDVRVIAATNRDLVAAMDSNHFRGDLYYRINVLHIAMAPLRDRIEDVPVLLDHFLGYYGSRHNIRPPVFSLEAVAAFAKHSWPGNVRELKNVVERLVLRRGGERVEVEHLPFEFHARPRQHHPSDDGLNAGLASDLFRRMVDHGESFWAVVHEPFMMRDLTRKEVRQLIGLGLRRTRGSYRQLVELFNLPASDYRKFLSFLRKHDCRLPFVRFRSLPKRKPLDRAG